MLLIDNAGSWGAWVAIDLPSGEVWRGPVVSDPIGSIGGTTALSDDGRLVALSIRAGDRSYNTTTFLALVTLPAESAPVDPTPPVVEGTTDRAPDAGGWYRNPVTVTWGATDPEPSSGAPSIPTPVEVSTEGADQVITSAPSCDAAGNCATGSVTVSVDRTAPTVALVAPASGARVKARDLRPFTCTVSDPLSGPGTCSVTVTGTNVGNRGTYTVTATGSDVAGNVTTVARQFTVTDLQPVLPVPECVSPLGSGRYAGRFGYRNPNLVPVSEPRGDKNRFLGVTTAQVPTHFEPGHHRQVIQAEFRGSLSWRLGSVVATLSASSRRC